MYNIVNTTDYPGWGYMVDQGATTIWESWGRDFAYEGGRRRSDNMTMLAGVNEFFYRYIAGIQGPNFYGAENMKPGYKEFRIKPYLLGELTSASATVKTVRGEISSSWELDDIGSFKLKVKVPANSKAQVSIPKQGNKNIIISENDSIVWSNNELSKGIEGLIKGVDDGDYITLSIGSGKYSFQASTE
jgi:alpha-L-rhamnosidase